MAPSLLDAAIDYANRGWPTFPCSVAVIGDEKSGKLPLLPACPNGGHKKCDGRCGHDGHGLYDGTTDLDRIRRWWTATPSANIGVRTGEPLGLWVLDIDAKLPKRDPKNGLTGFDGLEVLTSQHGPLPATLTARTGGGGLHMYFKVTPGRPVRNHGSMKVPGGRVAAIEVRGDGGLVIVPPSVHFSGGAYVWEVEMEPVEAPTWLLDWVEPREEARPAWTPAPTPRADDDQGRQWAREDLDRACSRIASAPSGARHESLNREAYTIGGRVAAGYLDESQARSALIAAGLHSYGGKDERVTETVNDAITKGKLKELRYTERPDRSPPHFDAPPPSDDDAPPSVELRPAIDVIAEIEAVKGNDTSLHATNYERMIRPEFIRELAVHPKREYARELLRGHTLNGFKDGRKIETALDRMIRQINKEKAAAEKAAAAAKLAEARAANLSALPFQMSDVGNRDLLAHLHGNNLRWCATMQGDGFLVWDDHRWIVDDMERTTQIASSIGTWWRDRALVATDATEREILEEWANSSESIGRIRAMSALVKPQIAIPRASLDADPLLFNAENRTIDLRTGRARGQRREDLITKAGSAAFESGAKCPTWERFLFDIMAGDQDLVSFLQRAVGYSLTGSVQEQCLFILHGNGSNGKSVFIEIVRRLLGDYAKNTPIETFTMKRDGGIPNDLAALAGARFVTAGESREGVALNEGLVKLVTGDDTISARFLNREFFDYRPMFKAWLPTNHKPEVRGTDNGIWRRLRLIPFGVTFDKERQDKELPAKLWAEAPGILEWAIRGCLEWQRIGLAPPAVVLAATNEYRQEMDLIQEFIDQHCEVGSRCGPENASALYNVFRRWAIECGHNPRNPNWFGRQLSEKGCGLVRTSEARMRSGISLKRGLSAVGQAA